MENTHTMKYYLLLLSLFSEVSFAQLTLVGEIDGVYISLRTLENAGPKLQTWYGDTVEIINLDLSVYRTIALPPAPIGFQYILPPQFILESTFDTDPSNIELGIHLWNGTERAFRVVGEDGSLIFEDLQASVQHNGGGDDLTYSPALFSDMNGTVYLLLGNYGNLTGMPFTTKVFTLHGTLPCFDCSDAGGVGIIDEGQTPGGTLLIHPNPTTDQLSIAYTAKMPLTKNNLLIYDAKGQVVNMFTLTGNDPVNISVHNLAHGRYSCSLISSGKIIASSTFVVLR